MLDPATTTVASVVLDHSECAPVFQRHRIDYCCKGRQSIQTACEERGVDPSTLLSELERAIAERTGGAGADPRTMPTPVLIDHIVSTHHAYLRETLPFVEALAAKVARVHGDHEPRLRDVDSLVHALAEILVPHLDAEEQVLFPALVAVREPAAIAQELTTMREDHVDVGALLEQVRTAADDFRAPGWACTSYRTLFSELERLEADVLRHVHLENHVLMPRFEDPTWNA